LKREEFSPANHEVLVVDDTQANLRLYGCLLEKSGFAVRTASGGAEALKEIETRVPALVLLDYMMPHTNGIDVLRVLRQKNETSRVPVIMLTASAAPDHIDLALEEGANDYITKPVNGKVLVARVKAMIQALTASSTRAESPKENALWADLEEAARVQQAQLPQVPFESEDILVSGAVIPSGKVGGDLFDIFCLENERYLCTLLDVAGHGTASALVASETRALLRSMLERRRPGAALFGVNQSMAQRTTGKFCCTAVVEIFGTTMTVVNAGLPPIVLLRGGEAIATVWGNGAPLGLFDDSLYEEVRLELAPGDRIVLLSDGITEPFGKIDDSAGAVERLRLGPLSTPELPSPSALRELMLQNSGLQGADDDRTVLVIDIPQVRSTQLWVPAQLEAIAPAIRSALAAAPPWVDPAALDHGLTEALTNAVLHGVLGVASEGRDADGYDDYLDAAESASRRAPNTLQAVDLEIRRSSSWLEFRLRWSGYPCPPEKQGPVSTPSDRGSSHDELLGSGMGLKIISSLFDEVAWDEDGYGVLLRFTRPTNDNSVDLGRLRSTVGFD
jgi:phosphoserine phosphatase RsbU/P